MNKKNTKRALLLSCLSLLLCVSMLVGSTFAWFTDNASTNVNTIESGTLKIKLEMSKDNGTTWEDAEGKTLDFLKAANAPADEAIRWEPGATYNLPLLRITNEGNLALKYKVEITGIKGDAKLNDAIDWTITAAGYNGASEGHLAATATENITISGHMKEAAGNEYQGLTITGISITVRATQDTVEYDSNNNTYDAIAQYSNGSVSSGDVKDDAAKGEDVVIDGAVMNEPVKTTVPGQNVTVESGTIDVTGDPNTFDPEAAIETDNGGKTVVNDGNFASDYYVLRQNAGSTTLNGGTYKGQFILYGNGQTLTINGGTYEADMLVYTDSTPNNATINGGTFHVNYIEVGGNNVVINGGSFSVDPTAYLSENYKAVKNGEMYDVVLKEFVKVDENTYEISGFEGLKEFAERVNTKGETFSGKTVKLTADIDMKNEEWNPIGQTGSTWFHGTFDGQYHTIKNLKVTTTNTGGNYASGLFGWSEGVTIKNLTIDGANVSGHHNVAVVIGYGYGTFTNVHVKNAAISCTNANDDANGDKCGLIIGYIGEDATLTNCTGTNSTVSAGRDAGQLVGAAKANCIGAECSALNVTVTSNGTGTGANIRNEIIGRVLAG